MNMSTRGSDMFMNCNLSEGAKKEYSNVHSLVILKYSLSQKFFMIHSYIEMIDDRERKRYIILK